MKEMGKPLTRAEKLEKLKLFNEKIQTLRRRNFIPQVFRTNHGVTLRLCPDEPLKVEKRGADEEALHAVVTTLRFFVQERDGINLNQVAEIYESLPVEDAAKRSARHAAENVNDYLDSNVPVGFMGEDITRRRLFDVFMYGNLAHANDDKKQEYRNWMNNSFGAAIMPMFLEETMAEMIRVIVSFEAMNERTIQQLQAVSAP